MQIPLNTTKLSKKMGLKSNGRKRVFLLLTIGLLHVGCMMMAFHLDLFRRSAYSFARISNVGYWMWIASWWCIWVGWLTIIWVIYKLTKKNPKSSYFEQIFDLTVLMANLLMIVAFLANFIIYYFCKVEWIYVPDTDNPNRVITLFNAWPIKTQTYFWFNIVISHLFAPLLLLYYFLKFSKVNLLRKNSRSVMVAIWLNPIVWFFFVILRKKLAIIEFIRTKFPMIFLGITPMSSFIALWDSRLMRRILIIPIVNFSPVMDGWHGAYWRSSFLFISVFIN